MTAAERPKAWRRGAAGLIVRFRLTPNSSKDAVDGVLETTDGPAFLARVRAAPEDGAANAALVTLVAEWLGLPKRSVDLATGARSRLKSLRIAGDADALGSALDDKVRDLKTAN